jgi:predicted metal-dependent HD superfamily phosphohydrolase
MATNLEREFVETVLRIPSLYQHPTTEWIGVIKKIASDTYSNLWTRYREPHRGYHTLSHIEAMLQEFESVRSLAIEPDAVWMAICIHDVIYNPRSSTNESNSALWARGFLHQIAATQPFIETVVDHIMATKHASAPTNLDAMLLVDLDLAILGQPAETFDEYERNIRHEYFFVSEADFRKGRSDILQGFLLRPTIYSTSHFQELYEKTARENLERSIRQLQ